MAKNFWDMDNVAMVDVFNDSEDQIVILWAFKPFAEAAHLADQWAPKHTKLAEHVESIEQV